MTRNNKIVLYHGSKSGIKGSIQAISRSTCDFGKGFYLGDLEEQAKTLVCTFPEAKYYEIELDLSGLKILKFDNYYDWILTIAYNRNVLDNFPFEEIKSKYSKFLNGYDVVRGKIANDRVFSSLDMYFQSAISKETLLECLELINLGNQYVCKSEKACKNLRILKESRLSEIDVEKRKKIRKDNIDKVYSMLDRVRLENLHKDGEYFYDYLKKQKEKC